MNIVTRSNLPANLIPQLNGHCSFVCLPGVTGCFPEQKSVNIILQDMNYDPHQVTRNQQQSYPWKKLIPIIDENRLALQRLPILLLRFELPGFGHEYCLTLSQDDNRVKRGDFEVAPSQCEPLE